MSDSCASVSLNVLILAVRVKNLDLVNDTNPVDVRYRSVDDQMAGDPMPSSLNFDHAGPGQ